MNSQRNLIIADNSTPVGVEDVTALIRKMGWSKIAHPNPNLLVYQYKAHDDRGKPIKMVLPAGNDYEDAGDMLKTAVKLIAALSHHSVEQVRQQLLNRGNDILRQRLITDVRITSLSLELAPKVIGFLRDMVYYAACSEEDPRPFFEKGLKVGKDYTAKCGFGHTFPGSFGLSIEMPIPPNPNDWLIPEEQVAPFERRIMQRVVRGLCSACKGVREGDVTVLTNDYAAGFNANLCEVMAELTGTLSGVKSEYSILWSPEYRVPDDLQSLEPVEIDPKVFRPYFEAAAKSLRQAKESQKAIVRGMVIQLHADSGDDDSDEDDGRQIIIKGDLGDQRGLKVHASLSVDDYKKACDAHRDNREVEIEGRPEKIGKFWNLTAPSQFRVVKPTD